MRAVLVGLVVAAFAMPARADGVDLLFMRNAETIAGKVRALQSKRVAVLKFAVKVGDGPARFDAGLANAKLAQKLENALLLARTDDDPMLLTGAAAKAKDLPADTTWQTPEGRAALAHMKGLPLAWDAKQQLSPDLFVSGELAFPKDAAGARLTLYAFTKADPAKLLTIYETRESPDAPPALPSDRNLMSLAGMSFSLDHPAANRIDGDKFAMQQVVAGLKGENAFAKAVQNSPIQLTILARGKGAPTSDDRAMIPETDPKAPGGGRIATPREGDQLTLRLKNAHPTKRFAVVLAVNGKNTNATSKNHELNSLDAKEQKMWVLDPKEEITLRGFSTDAAGGYDPFTVLDDATSEKLFPLMGELYRGLITMHVFAEREAAPLKSTGGTAPPPMIPRAGTRSGSGNVARDARHRRRPAERGAQLGVAREGPRGVGEAD